MNSNKWKIKEIPGKLFEIINSEGFPILKIRGGMFPVPKDAQLISAAPDLLSACEIVQANLKSLTEDIHLRAAFQAVSEAIKKAKRE